MSTAKYSRARSQRAHVSRSLAERQAELAAFSPSELADQARDIVLRSLTASAKSRASVASLLEARGFPDQVVDHVVGRMVEVGLIDDAAYAASMVRVLHGERGQSRRAIAVELRRRGIDEDTAEAALAALDDTADDLAARKIAQVRLAKTRGLDPQVRMRRAMGALARKGFSPQQAADVVSQELARERLEGSQENGSSLY